MPYVNKFSRRKLAETLSTPLCTNCVKIHFNYMSNVLSSDI